MNAFTPNLNMDMRSRAELHRETLSDYRSESARAQLEADRRNLELLKGDSRLVRMCRAYFLTDESGRDELDALATRLNVEAMDRAAQ